MKIIMLGSGSYRASLSIRIVALAGQLAKLDWEVSIIVPSADKYNNFTKENINKDGAISVIQPWQPSTRSSVLNLLPYLITSMIVLVRSRTDFVYLYKPTPITIIGLIQGLLFQTPVILDLDDLGSEVMRAENQSRLQSGLVSLCERLAIKYSSAIVVTSTFLQRQIQVKYPNKHVLVLPNGVNPMQYPLRPSRQLRPAIYYFGMVNRLSLIEPLLRAIPLVLKAVPTARFTIIGGGSALNEAKLLVKNLGVSYAVTFTGMTDMLGVVSFTEFGDIGVCYQPDIDTVKAASNMKVFQYMALSTVPVVSSVGDLPTYIDDGRAGVAVKADDSQALGEALISLLQNKRRRTQYALRARQLSETTYAWSSIALQLSSFLSEHAPKYQSHSRRRSES
jgi:glycosyltransferase involved in cell wall biosynthesis